jgi:hypothetical protein
MRAPARPGAIEHGANPVRRDAGYGQIRSSRSRYLAEFDFRHNNRSAVGVEDGERAAKLLRGAVGKRLTYRGPHKAANQEAAS